MALLGSALGRALAGAGGAAAEIGSRYVDQQLMLQRAQALEELRRASAIAMDQYNLSEPRQARLRDIDAQATKSQARAGREAELEGYQDESFQGARRAHADAEAQAETGRRIKGRKAELEELTPTEIDAERRKLRELTPEQVAAQRQVLEGTMGAEAKRASLLAEAAARAQAKFRAPTEGSAQAIEAKFAALEKVMGRPLTDDEKQALIGITKAAPDSFMPVPLKDEMGNVTGYQVFDRRRGTFVNQQGADAGNDPLRLRVGQPQQADAPQAKPKADARKEEPSGPGLLERAKSMVGRGVEKASDLIGRANAMPAPNLEAHAQSALLARDKVAIRRLLEQPGAEQNLKPETLAKLRAALQ